MRINNTQDNTFTARISVINGNSDQWSNTYTVVNSNSASWSGGGGGGISIGTVQTYLSSNNVLLNGTTVTGNVSASGALSATTIFTTGSGNVIIDRGNYRRNNDPTIIIGANSDQHLRFRAGGDTSAEIRMTILSSGEVGIGTNIAETAAARLTVSGNISASGSINALSSNVGIVVDNKTTSYTLTNADNNKTIHFDTTVQSLCAIFPSSLRTNFNCAVMNTGTNVLTLSTYTTLRAIAPNISTQYGAAFVYKDSSNNIYAVGRL